MKKICVIFGTRPEAIKLAPVINELKSKKIVLKVIVTSQHREMLNQVLRIFRIKPHYDLKVMTHNQSLFDITAKITSGLEKILKKEKPSMIIVQGDTTTTFISSLAAFYLKIPIAHVEAGLRTSDKFRPFPEEMNRRLTSSLADYNFAPTVQAKKALLSENIPKNKIWVTGNTVVDALKLMLKSKIHFKNPFLKKFDFSKRKLILVTLHRRESFDGGLKNVLTALKMVAKNNDVDIIYPVHMNPNVKREVRKVIGKTARIHLLKPLPYDEFVLLMSKSHFVITDSGGIQEEVCTLNKPVLVAREKTERQEAVQAGFAKLVGYKINLIVREASKLLNNTKYYRSMCRRSNPFGDGKAAKKIINILKKQ